MRVLFLLFHITFLASFLFAQDTLKKVPYSQDYIFKDGIYITFNQFIENNPLPKYKIVSSVPPTSPAYLYEVTQKDTFHYIGDNGYITPYPTKKIWGFSENNTVFIQYLNQFNRIIIIGTIGFFMSQVTVTSTIYNDPYYYSSYYNPYYYYPGINLPHEVKNNEIKRFLIDFRTGNVIPFSYKNLEVLLSADTELYNEYLSLSKRKRKKMIFLYLRRFNERNPLLLPPN